MTLFATSMADNQLVIGSLNNRMLLGNYVKSVNPVFLFRMASKIHKGEELRIDRIPYMCVLAVWTFGTETKHVVQANFQGVIVPKNARPRVKVIAQLAEPPVVVWAPLSFLELGTLLRLGVTVDAILLFMTHAVLLDELTNRHFVYIILVQEITLVSFFTGVAQPVNTNLLLALLITNFVLVR